MRNLEGRPVIVTGAASGIGEATVRRLHADGARVVAVDLDEAAVEKVTGSLEGGAPAVACAADITEAAAVEDVIERAAERDGLYGLVNCAGVRGVGTVLDTDEETWRRVLSVNLDGTVRTCQAFVRRLDAAGSPGAVVNITSAAGIMAVPNRFGYVASKFGLSGATRAMAVELAPRGIRVNAIAPGTIRTPMTAGMFATNAERIRAAHPIGREGQPEEVASVASFLLSDDASFVVGVVLPVDGGSTVAIPEP